ncbi:hypothetical protein SLS62_008073 [Diatrype stigma]|uniref:DASH complex subunit ASK1 n=1 Tax=Diatrype stigma TaxID=117547 RepID=A0AAN9UKJ7_9PEZI
MSRAPSLSSGRNLTLPEELERLEQSITLTLQEIDHNFSKAHRIVTGSILPLVEQYGENSKSVWEASKFWKQFFEASANVSLSGYEELAEENDESTAAETTLEDEATSEYSAAVQDDNDAGDDTTVEQPGYHEPQQQQQQQRQRRDVEESLLDDVEMSGSTPRPPAGKSLKAQKLFADFDSPYEKLRREMQSGGGGKGGGGGNENITVKTEDDGEEQQQQPLGDNVDDDDDETMEMELPAHATGKATTRLPDMSMTGRSSSLLLDEPTMTLQGGRQLQQTFEQSRSGNSNSTKTKDPLLHRMLHKNYRLQATPHKGAPLLAPPANAAWALSPDKGKGKTQDEDRTRRALWADSPTSSPEMAVPKLRSDLYMSPAKAKGARRGAAANKAAGHHYNEPPRTPGVSVQTPGTARKTRDVFAEEREREAEKAAKGKGKAGGGKGSPDEIKWDSDSDDDTEGGGGGLFGGMSPPKTIQFALPPSKLMRTPAREASKRIVEDILLTAGAAPEESSEYSPTMVKMNQDILDDTF